MFQLDPKLAADTAILGDLPLCRVLLMNDSHWPWLILVPRRDNAAEICDLDVIDQHRLIDESTQVSHVMQRLFEPDKLNVAALGNQVRQLHVHHIARYRHDPAWPAPVWGRLKAEPYSADALTALSGRLAAAIHGLEPVR